MDNACQTYKTMIRITDRSRCCGCTACASACPHDAIVMKPDEMGFLYPYVLHDRCVDCGLCERVCAFTETSDKDEVPSVAFGVRNRDLETLLSSRSGGVFPAIAEKIVSDGGTVYGAAFDEGFRVVHKRAVDMAAVKEFSGSKYVQSGLEGIFALVKDDLRSGKKVLFSGTPCQTAGLKSFLNESLTRNLYLVDIVCHGVPSPVVWEDYVRYQTDRIGGRLTEVSFRDKRLFGWKEHVESFRSGDKVLTDRSFTHLFYEHVMLRDSCHACPYASVRRVSDMTLADFWGWQDVLPGFNDDDRGVSLVICSTAKGREMLAEASGYLDIEEVSLRRCLQPNLVRPSRPGRNREAFMRDYPVKGLEYVLARYGDKGWRYRVYKAYMDMKYKIKSYFAR